MPELRLRDFRIPELKLPEMTRDDIARALGDARKEIGDVRRDLNEMRREMAVPRVEVPRVELPKVELPRVEMPKEARKAARKAGKTVTKAAQDVGLVKKPASRMPLVIAAGIALALVGWALANSPEIKARLRALASQARERMAERDRTWDADLDDEPRAFDAAVAVPVEPSAYADSLPGSDSPYAEPPTDLPDGFGKTNGAHAIEDDATTRA